MARIQYGSSRSVRSSRKTGGEPPKWALTGKPITKNGSRGNNVVSWAKKPNAQADERSEQLRLQANYKQQQAAENADERGEQLRLQANYKQQQANEYATARYSALLRERFLSNVMGPRRNNYDVGINDISTLDAYNRIWGSTSVTEQERIRRQNATQPGLMWTPYGYQGRTAYVPIRGVNPPEKKMKTSYSPAGPSGYGGGGGYGYNDWGTGGGGGGGGGGSSMPNWYTDLMTWKIK